MGSGGTDRNHRQLFLPLAPFAMVPHFPLTGEAPTPLFLFPSIIANSTNPSGVSMSTHLKFKQVGMIKPPTTIAAARRLTRVPQLSSSTRKIRHNNIIANFGAARVSRQPCVAIWKLLLVVVIVCYAQSPGGKN